MFKITLDPIMRWLGPQWNEHYPVGDMHFALVDAVNLLEGAKRSWVQVRGPAYAYVATLHRIGWTMTGPTTLATQTGEIDTVTMAPAAV